MKKEQNTLIEVRKLKKVFTLKHNVKLTAVNDVSFKIKRGEKFGVVGESGCGKSTLGRVILQLYPQTSGSTVYHGTSIEDLNPSYIRREILKMKEYQSKAIDFYNEALKIGEKSRDLKNQRDEIDVAGSAADTRKYDGLSRKIDKLDYQTKELKKSASRSLREGSRTIGSLVLSPYIDEIKERYLVGLKHSENIHLLLKKRKLVDAKYQSCLFEIEKDHKNEKAKIDECALQTDLIKLDERIEELHQAVKQVRKDVYREFKGKDYLQITEQTHTKAYQNKLDANYETGLNLSKLSEAELQPIRKELQMIFQDPAASLDPRQSIGSAIEEVFIINTKYSKEVRKEKTVELLEKVGLKADFYDRYPHVLSGGQKQRVGIARAIALNTNFIVLDEAVSALDVSVQAQILKLLNDLSEDFGLTYFFITHDLGVVKHFCDRILVMYLGHACELAESKELFREPLHPYTQSLLEAVPRPRVLERKKAETIQGEVPSPIHQPKGCPFHTRCSKVMDICKKDKPVYHEVKDNHFVACHLFAEKKA